LHNFNMWPAIIQSSMVERLCSRARTFNEAVYAENYDVHG